MKDTTSKIKKLPESVISQIAAGEVIERPSSVVKELVDNSIDAGAKKVIVELKNGGIDYIKIEDDGGGIDKEDIRSAFSNHFTSKISQFDDLNSLITNGFRGEALATISSVSKVKVLTKTDNDELAYEYQINFSKEGEIKKSSRNRGTTFEIKGLFDEIPARKKFLRSAQTEYKYTLKILQSFFIAYPSIAFELYHNDKLIIKLPSDQSSKERIEEIFKKSQYAQELIPFDFESSGINFNGYVTHPKFKTTNIPSKFIFVNKRSITDKVIHMAIKNGSKGFMPHDGKFGYFVFLDLDPSQVDINTHPRKEEVRFLNPYRIGAYITDAVAKALSNLNKDNLVIEDNITISENSEQNEFKSKGDRTADFLSRFGEGEVSSSERYSRGSYSQNSSTNSNFTSNPSVTRSTINKPASSAQVDRSLSFTGALFETNSSNFNNEFESLSFTQFNKKYIIVCKGSTLQIIDQHAASERATYEKLLKQFKDKDIDIQRMLTPVEVDLTKAEADISPETLSQIGFEFEQENEILMITGYPALLNSFTEDTIYSMFCEDKIQESSNEVPKEISDLIATIACHSSIRKGDRLEVHEMKKIYEDLIKCKNSYSCPHGRPLMWEQKLTDIDKHFDRTY